MVVNDDAYSLAECGALGLIASKLRSYRSKKCRQKRQAQGLLGMPYLRRRWAMAVWEVCRRLASWRVEG